MIDCVRQILSPLRKYNVKINFQDREGVRDYLRPLIERLSRYSGGHKSPMAAAIHQYLITQNKREQKLRMVESKPHIRTDTEENFVAGE